MVQFTIFFWYNVPYFLVWITIFCEGLFLCSVVCLSSRQTQLSTSKMFIEIISVLLQVLVFFFIFFFFAFYFYIYFYFFFCLVFLFWGKFSSGTSCSSNFIEQLSWHRD